MQGVCGQLIKRVGLAPGVVLSRRRIDRDVNRGPIIQRIQYIPDNEMALYFNATYILAIPYTHVSFRVECSSWHLTSACL